jgi:tetratricopeptide (TPR) repeat protein
MKVLSSGVSVCLLAVMASLSVAPQSEVLAQEILMVSQTLSESAQQQALTHNYQLAQSTTDPQVLLEQVNAYIKAGNIDQALVVANRISDLFSQLSVLWSIADSYIEVGNIDQANRILEQALATANRISDPLLQSLELNDIAFVYAQAGQLKKADEILGQALAVANQIENLETRSEVIDVIMEISRTLELEN